MINNSLRKSRQEGRLSGAHKSRPMSPQEIAALRRQTFATWHALDDNLSHVGKQLPSHSFLGNPAGQQVFLYLSHFSALLAQRWFARSPQEIKVLDWGAGKGQVTYLLTQHGFTPDSCDLVDTEPLRPLLERTGIGLIALEHDYELPFADASYDMVLSFGVLEHVPNDRESLREIFRVLRPGGLLLCYNLPGARSWIMHLAHLMGNHYHDRLYERAGVSQMLHECGYQVLDMWQRQLFPKNRLPYPMPWLWERLDQWLVEHTPLGRLATSLEFVALRPR